MITVGINSRHSSHAAVHNELRAGKATFAMRRCSPSRLAIGVLGDIDAVNGRALARYVEQNTSYSDQLVLDLRAVDFFGIPGFCALYYIGVHCARTEVDWVIVAGDAARRLLAICDPDHTLPMSEDLCSALARLDRLPHHGVRRTARAMR